MTIEQKIRKHYIDELYWVEKEHKWLQMIHQFFVPLVCRFTNMTNLHIQIAKEVIEERVSKEIFGGCEPTFEDDYAYNWWTNLSINYFEPYEEVKPWKTVKGWRLKQEFPVPKLIFELHG